MWLHGDQSRSPPCLNLYDYVLGITGLFLCSVIVIDYEKVFSKSCFFHGLIWLGNLYERYYRRGAECFPQDVGVHFAGTAGGDRDYWFA